MRSSDDNSTLSEASLFAKTYVCLRNKKKKTPYHCIASIIEWTKLACYTFNINRTFDMNTKTFIKASINNDNIFEFIFQAKTKLNMRTWFCKNKVYQLRVSLYLSYHISYLQKHSQHCKLLKDKHTQKIRHFIWKKGNDEIYENIKMSYIGNLSTLFWGRYFRKLSLLKRIY